MSVRKWFHLCLCLLSAALLLGSSVSAAEPASASASPGLPAWYQTNLEQLTRGDGRWVADNATYRSEQEPFTHFVTEWKKTPDGRGVTGRLYGLTGKQQSPDFWSFRIYWDASAAGAVIQQFAGHGVIGIGPLVGFGEATLSDQTFTAPNGKQWRSMHHSWYEGDVHVTRSFDWNNGGWEAQREYRWRLRP